MKARMLVPHTTLAPNVWSSKQTARAFRIYAFFSPTTCVAAHFDGDGNQLTASPRPTPSSPPAQGGTRVAAARACRNYDDDNARIEQPASRRKRPARHTLRFFLAKTCRLTLVERARRSDHMLALCMIEHQAVISKGEFWVMLQYRQADPSHVDHEGRRLHSEARAPAGVGSGTCGLLACFALFY